MLIKLRICLKLLLTNRTFEFLAREMTEHVLIEPFLLEELSIADLALDVFFLSRFVCQQVLLVSVHQEELFATSFTNEFRLVAILVCRKLLKCRKTAAALRALKLVHHF